MGLCRSFGCGGAGSYFSPPALRGVDVCCTSSWVSFYASSCGSCGFLRRVLLRVTFGGYSTFLAQVACPAPAVELCVGFEASSVRRWGLPCAVLFFRLLWFALLTLTPVTLGRFYPFWPRLPALLLCWSWAATFPWCSPGFTFSGRLAVVRWVLHPVSGCSLFG